ncbi:ABC transporter permease [Rickettsiella grylli]|uniref:ABC transporter permease protein n=1 Tax=Rickettsiella grylli TaxID=59196 RepID=A8PP63_9COXI|nr:ABC transporter permease [Rickettsiella grylli]EDP46877.1 ABC transporter permease protein [Rickettsiella grylli]
MYVFVFLRNQLSQLQKLFLASRTITFRVCKQYIQKSLALLFHQCCIPLWFIFIWTSLIRVFHLPHYLLPTPIDVLQSLIKQGSFIFFQAIPTVLEIFFGFTLSVLLGISIALCMCSFRPLHTLLFPLLLASQVLPVFAIAPVLVLWLGYGIMVKIMTTVFMLFFPITNNFLDGLKQTPETYLNIAKIMNSSSWQILYQIRIPSALPHLASGIRLATAMAPLAAIIGEWVGANQGLGFLLLNANAQMQIDLMFAVLFVLFFLGVLFYFFIDTLLQWALPWSFR